MASISTIWYISVEDIFMELHSEDIVAEEMSQEPDLYDFVQFI